MRYLFLILLFVSGASEAQIIKSGDKTILQDDQDSLVIDSGRKDSLKIYKPTINDYTYFTQFSERKVFDTTFSISKAYQFTQYTNLDSFGKIQFANVGSGYQNLVFQTNSEQNLALLPSNKMYGILGVNDVKYYDVKTPTTSFVYHNTIKNGGQLQTTYTQNIGKSFNFAVEYMGLRSQGLYKNSLASNNNTYFSAHYKALNGKYEFFAHYLHQNVNNQENGGIADLSVFTGGDTRFDNRENIEMNLSNVDTRYGYRRYYFSHQFAPFDVEKYPFKVRHTLMHQGNKYYFFQKSLDDYFYQEQSDILEDMPLDSKKYSKNLSNAVSLLWDTSKFNLEAGVRHQNIKFGTNYSQVQGNPVLPKIYDENRLGLVGKLEINLWDKFDLLSNLEYSNGNSFGNYIRSTNFVSFEPIKEYKAEAFVNFQSAAPSFNYLLNYSPYRNYNFDFSGFENQNVLEIGGKINLKYFNSQLFATYYKVDKYAYFDQNHQPKQSESSLDVSQIGGEATFDFNKFHLNTRVLFQSTLTNKELFPAPNFIGRANFYYQSKAFKNAAEIQTGIKLYYFTKFDSRNYSPMLNEFSLADASSYPIGGKPIVDVYFNLKVKRMFFFVEGQQVTTMLMDNRSYTAPYYPIYDFRLNLGIVWYLFH